MKNRGNGEKIKNRKYLKEDKKRNNLFNRKHIIYIKNRKKKYI